MKELKIKELSCVECPKYDDYILIKNCLSCPNFEGSFKLKDEKCIDNNIPCSFDEQIEKDIINHMMYLSDEKAEEIFKKVIDYKRIAICRSSFGNKEINNE